MMRLAKITGGVLAAFVAAVAFLAFNPQVLFAYELRGATLTLRTTVPIDPVDGRALLYRVVQRLANSPLADRDTTGLAINVGNGQWREALAFSLVPNAGGVAYLPSMTTDVYLRRVDLERDRLFKGTFELQPPRDATYYATHELAHLVMGHGMGTRAFWSLPFWLREGMADYVALGAVDKAQTRAILNDPEPWFAHGSYAVERALVSFMMRERGMSWDDLTGLDISREAALTQLQHSLERSP